MFQHLDQTSSVCDKVAPMTKVVMFVRRGLHGSQGSNTNHCSHWMPVLTRLPSPGGLNKQQPLIPHSFPWCLNVLHCHYIRCPSYMHPSLERDIQHTHG